MSQLSFCPFGDAPPMWMKHYFYIKYVNIKANFINVALRAGLTTVLFYHFFFV